MSDRLMIVLVVIFMLHLTVAQRRRQVDRPNIVLLITDDQDVMLGSMNFMPRVKNILMENGVNFVNAFVTSPICCPSRSSILTGMYAHNHNVLTNNANCSQGVWLAEHENRTFATYVQASGYRTGYMGKYLNRYNGSHIPPGYHSWMGLVKNSRFYNYTVNFNGRLIKHGDEYGKDYFTDLVANDSIRFIHQQRRLYPRKPFLLVSSFPAPHGPEDPAPQHADMFNEEKSHRTMAYNYAPNPDKMWLLQRTGKMEPVHVAFTDLLQRRRLQTLQSVDVAVQRIVTTLRDLRQLSNTYIIYTSDHGYHLGQFGLVKGKNMPFEFDIRVPFFMRGPRLSKGQEISLPVANIDIAPTILSMARVPIPPHMDGQSILPIAVKDSPSPRRWRTSLLIERGKMSAQRMAIGLRVAQQAMSHNKEARLKIECNKEEYRGECEGSQKWKCIEGDGGRPRMIKCRQSGDNEECSCDGLDRRRRSLSGEFHNSIVDSDQSALTEEFFMDLTNADLESSGAWTQGVFEETSPPKRTRRSPQTTDGDCSCGHGDEGHPMRRVDDRIEHMSATQLRALRRSLRKKKNRHGQIGTGRKARHRDKKLFCNVSAMSCFTHDQHHWTTPPKWPESLGSFCFCQNTNNNTYWCVRTVAEGDNSLYCEYITGFVSYYDLHDDPHQLRNIVYTLTLTRLDQLHEQLNLLRECRGGAECNAHTTLLPS